MTTDLVVSNPTSHEVEVYAGAGGPVNDLPVPYGFDPIPIPADWTVNWDAIRKAERPNKSKVFVHPKGFPYIKIGYIIEVLNSAFGPGRWIFRKSSIFAGEEQTRQSGGKTVVEQEITVEGYLFAPGIAAPIYGIGSAFWYPKNPGAARSQAVAAAETVALKNAAKKLGIGANLNDGSEDGDAAIANDQRTCETLFKNFANIGKTDDALKVVRKIAPEALKDGSLVGALIDVDHVEALRTALTEAMISVQS